MRPALTARAERSRQDFTRRQVTRKGARRTTVGPQPRSFAEDVFSPLFSGLIWTAEHGYLHDPPVWGGVLRSYTSNIEFIPFRNRHVKKKISQIMFRRRALSKSGETGRGIMNGWRTVAETDRLKTRGLLTANSGDRDGPGVRMRWQGGQRGRLSPSTSTTMGLKRRASSSESSQ